MTQAVATATKPVSQAAANATAPVTQAVAAATKPVTQAVATATKPVTQAVATATKPVTQAVATATRPVTQTVARRRSPWLRPWPTPRARQPRPSGGSHPGDTGDGANGRIRHAADGAGRRRGDAPCPQGRALRSEGRAEAGGAHRRVRRDEDDCALARPQRGPLRRFGRCDRLRVTRRSSEPVRAAQSAAAPHRHLRVVRASGATPARAIGGGRAELPARPVAVRLAPAVARGPVTFAGLPVAAPAAPAPAPVAAAVPAGGSDSADAALGLAALLGAGGFALVRLRQSAAAAGLDDAGTLTALGHSASIFWAGSCYPSGARAARSR